MIARVRWLREQMDERERRLADPETSPEDAERALREWKAFADEWVPLRSKLITSG